MVAFLTQSHLFAVQVVARMPDDRLPKHGELCYGKRSAGGQNKRFKDTLKKTPTSFSIVVTNWEACVLTQYDSDRSNNA